MNRNSLKKCRGGFSFSCPFSTNGKADRFPSACTTLILRSKQRMWLSGNWNSLDQVRQFLSYGLCGVDGRCYLQDTLQLLEFGTYKLEGFGVICTSGDISP